MTEPRRQRIDLEKALAELEDIVTELEAGDMPLDKSLKQFERVVRLSRECQAALKDAGKKVQVLMDAGLKDLDVAPSGAGPDDEPGEDTEEDGQ